MTGFDYFVLFVLGISVLLSMMRGIVREVLSLIGWLFSLLAARILTGTVAEFLPQAIPTQPLRMLAAFVVVFFGAWVVMSVIRATLGHLVESLGLASVDKSLGALFGLARGLLILTVCVVLAGLTSFPKTPMWKNAMFSAPLEAVAEGVKPLLPEAMARYIHF